VRTALIGAGLLLVGVVAVIAGILPISDVAVLFDRVWPILLFVIGITITTELVAEAGVFQSIGQRLARWGRGRAVLLWLMVVAFAALSTIFLSLDTTAVLLTPIVVILARQAGLNPLPFALTTVWLANTASLLLPVSNLTNLLAEHELGGIGTLGFVALTWAPAVVAIVVPVVVIGILCRTALSGTYSVQDAAPSEDRTLFTWSAGVLALLVPALVSPLPVWIPACSAAVVLLAVFAVRRRSVLTFSMVPWQLVLFASGLFIVIEVGHSLGLTAVLATVAGQGESAAALLQLGGVGLATANIADNLPAYLALEPLADSPARLIALLIGVNAGPLITPWASLATLLWHQRLTKLGIEISWARYAALGLVVAPLTVAASILALVVVLGK
jgi:arsenical pump membrane protein